VLGREQAFLAEIEELAAASRTTVYALKVDAPQIDTSEQTSPPSPQEDDRMREAGLQAVTAIARGELMRAHYNPGPIFERLERELSGYYLLGVEARPEDSRYLAELGGSPVSFGKPDVSCKRFRSNPAVRWEDWPGAVLYLVWSEGRNHSAGTGQFDFDSDLGELFGVMPDNIFMVKLSYWLSR